MDWFYYFCYLLFFLFALHIMCEKFPVILTQVKYNKNGKSVRYTISILKKVAYDKEHFLLDQEDGKVLLFIYVINHFFNMNVRIL